jgi:alpha-soluble NSF attachment protein
MDDAARCLRVAINQFCNKGNFRRAASQMESLGEVFEQGGDNKQALECFETAAGWYETDNASA